MLAALLALAAVVAGCGGGSSSSSSNATESATTAAGESGDDAAGDESGSEGEDESGSDDSGGAAPSKAAFIKEADKICSDADATMSEEISKYAEEKGIPISEEEPSEDQQIEIFHAVILPNIGKQAEEIAALTPPKGDEGTIEELTDTLSSEVAEAEEADGTPDESTLEGATKMAQEYGLKTCGS
jgi:hypothetical protein